MAFTLQRRIKIDFEPASRFQHMWRVLRITVVVLGLILCLYFFPFQTFLLLIIGQIIARFISVRKQNPLSEDAAYWRAEKERVLRAFSITLPVEQERVAQAFNITESCSFLIPETPSCDFLERRFRKEPNYKVSVHAVLTSSLNSEHPTWFAYGNMHVQIYFGTRRYALKFMRGRWEKSERGIASVELSIPVGESTKIASPSISFFDQFTTDELQHVAKGIFHLGLLDTKLENGLGVSISAHERLEWAM